MVFSTYNEKNTIRKCINDFFATGVVDEIIAVDNNSAKGTKEEILKTKAKYFHEPKQGMGYGYQRAMKEATGEIIITTEVDGTYSAKDIFKLLAYSDDFDVVCGTRTTSILIREGANMGFAMKWANWFFAKIIEFSYNTTTLTDVGCFYRLIKRKSYNKIKKYEMYGKHYFLPDWMLYMIRNKINFIEIPVNFHKRVGESYGAGNYWKAAKVALGMFFVIYLPHRFKIKKI